MDQPSIFVSYAWKAENECNIVECNVVDNLEAAFRENNLSLNRDKQLEYKASIKEFMDRLGAGDCVIVVISEAYLQSHYCMEELLHVYRNGEFHNRVFPVVMKGIRIDRPNDRLRFVEFWEKEYDELENRTKRVSQKHIENVQNDLNLYADIRDNTDHLMKFLSDMNSLTEDVHVGTNFEALIGKIRVRIESLAGDESDKEASEKFRQKFNSVLNEEIERPVCRDLKNALATQCGNSNIVQAFEICCRRPEGGLEQAIEWLHQATEMVLRNMRDKNASDQERLWVWEAAKTILGWLVLLSVDEHWFDKHKKRLQSSERNFKIDIPARNHVTIEIVLSRNKEKAAIFIASPSGSTVFGGHSINNAISEFGLNAASGSEQIKLTIWNYLYGETRSDFLDVEESEKLRSLIRTRSRREGDYYYTIHPSDRQSPFNSEEIRKYLASELPELKLISIQLDGEDSALVVSEIDLEVLISEFLNIGKNWL